MIITPESKLPEVTVEREVSMNTVLSQTAYFLPLGECFLGADTETELEYGGAIHYPNDGFYTHIGRSIPPWMNIGDIKIGIALTTPPPAGVSLRLRWRQRIILHVPPSVLLVHVHLVGGIYRPDYTLHGWRQDDPLLAPDAIQVAVPPEGYAVEWWRLTRQKGGDHGAGTGYRAGRRYLPVFRGPAVGTDNAGLFLRTQFDPGSDSRPWRHYRVCYYNLENGARSALSAEVVVSAGTKPDQHNGSGPCRYNLWINR
jgi:hypothetical protein